MLERFLTLYALKKGGSGGGGSPGGGGSGGGSTEEWIGDGNTHIWITLGEGRTSPMLGVCPNGTVTVDWGDGTTPDVLTGTSVDSSDVQWTPTHNYAKPGDYVITLTVDGEMGFSGNWPDGSRILRYSSSADSRNSAYQAAVQRIEIGNGVTRINYYSCNNCYSLSSVVIPEGVASIDGMAFADCPVIRYIDFSKHTAVPTLAGTNAFSNIPGDCEIRVPAALADEWKAATNWATYASQIVAV